MRRGITIAASCAVLVVGGSVLPGGAEAVSGARAQVTTTATTIPAGTLRVRPIAVSGYRSFARTGDTVWREMDDVVPFSADGSELSRVPGLPDSVGIATDTAGTVLYSAAWLPHTITAVDPVTRTIQHSWAALCYVVSMAVSGTHLYYSCMVGGGPAGVAVLDLATGLSTRLPTIATSGTPDLAASGSTLMVRSGETLSTYAVDVDGGLTKLAERTLAAQEYALSPQGTELLVSGVDADGAMRVRQLSTMTLQTKRTLTLQSQVTALAWASDGTRYAVGFAMQGTGDVVQVRDAASGALVAHSVWPGATSLQYQAVGHLTFDPDEPFIRGFGGSDARQSVFLTASTQPGTAATMTVTTKSPSTYGKPLHAEIRTTRCTPCTVKFTLADSIAGKRSFTRTVSGGQLSLDLAVKGNGTLTVILPATLNRAQVTRKRSYVVPARPTVTLTGSYTIKNGTAVYTGSKPTVLVVVAPARRVYVQELTQWRLHGTWTTGASRMLRTGANGRLRTTSTWVLDTPYRLVYRVIRDDFVYESPPVITRVLRYVRD